MNGNMYRYTLGSDVSMTDVQDSLQLAVLAMECLHGSALGCRASANQRLFLLMRQVKDGLSDILTQKCRKSR